MVLVVAIAVDRPRGARRHWSRTISSTSSATRSSATPASSCSRWPSLDPAGWAPARIWILVFVVDPKRLRGLGRRDPGRSSGAAGSTTCAAGRFDRRSWRWRSPWSCWPRSGCPGWLAFEARASLVSLALDGPAGDPGVHRDVRAAGLLRAAAGRRPRPTRSGPAPPTDWRPQLRRFDLTSPLAWARSTWDLNRAFSAALIAALLGVLALATSVGAFGAAEAAAAVPAALEGPSESFAPAPVGSGEPSFQPTRRGADHDGCAEHVVADPAAGAVRGAVVRPLAAE